MASLVTLCYTRLCPKNLDTTVMMMHGKNTAFNEIKIKTKTSSIHLITTKITFKFLQQCSVQRQSIH